MAEVNQIATMTQMKGSDTSAPIPADDTTPTQNQPDLKNPENGSGLVTGRKLKLKAK
jgi:hypothetical protein